MYIEKISNILFYNNLLERFYKEEIIFSIIILIITWYEELKWAIIKID